MNMLRPDHPDVALLESVAESLEPILDDVVLVGGCATVLLISDPGAPPPSGTFDVDLVVEAVTYLEYEAYAAKVRSLGFQPAMGEDQPICRFTGHGLVIDLMPHDQTVLGFGNPWFGDALESCLTRVLPSGRVIRHVSAPCYLATKLAAFESRGRRDYLSSKDIEDILAVVDGRPTILTECLDGGRAVRRFVADRIRVLLQDPDFIDSLPGAAPGGSVEQQRIPILAARLEALADT